MAHTIELTDVVSANSIPEGENIGDAVVRVLSVSSGSTPAASQTLVYNQPEQETPIGSGTIGRIFVVDPIIKKPI